MFGTFCLNCDIWGACKHVRDEINYFAISNEIFAITRDLEILKSMDKDIGTYMYLVFKFYHIPFTDWESNAHSMTVQRGQNVHSVPSL